MERREFAQSLLAGLSGGELSRFLATNEDSRRIEERSTVDTVKGLRGMEPGDSQVVLVLGYHEPFDGGGGLFVSVPASTVDPDGGIVVMPEGHDTSTQGRWRRVVTDEAINLLWFGARRDDEADAAPALQSAISALREFNGSEEKASRQHPEAGYHGTLYIPRGTYRIGQPVQVDIGGIRVVGDGAHSTVLRAGGELESSDAILEVEGSDYGTTPGPVRRTYFADLMIRGRGTEPKKEPVGIRTKQMNYWMFERLDLHYLSYGMRLQKSFVGHLQNVHVLRTHKGTLINSVSHNVSIVACKFNNTSASGGAGLRVRGCAGFSVVSTNFERADIGLRMGDGIKGASVTGCYFEKNTDADIALEGQSLDVKERKEKVVEGVSITGNLFNSSKRSAIYVQGNDNHPVSGVQVAGNYVDSGTGYLLFLDDRGAYKLNSFSIAGNALDTPNPAQHTNLSGKQSDKMEREGEDDGSLSGDKERAVSVRSKLDPETASTEDIAKAVNEIIDSI